MKIISRSLIVFGLLIINCTSYAKDIGVMSDVYDIREYDLIEWIQNRVRTMQKNGQWQTVQDAMRKKAMSYRDRPTPVNGLSKATRTKTWIFDPSIRLGKSVYSPDGKILAVAGTHINPLTVIRLSKTLIFFDGDDADQVQWVLSQISLLNGRVKLILVKGSLLTLEKICHQPIYFDQTGRLTTHFNIQHVPASVAQEGWQLRITEVAV